jgi:hypothetical protein
VNRDTDTPVQPKQFLFFWADTRSTDPFLNPFDALIEIMTERGSKEAEEWKVLSDVWSVTYENGKSLSIAGKMRR